MGVRLSVVKIKEKVMDYRDFEEALGEGDLVFVQDLNSYLSDNRCQATYEKKKTGLVGSYKYGKNKKALVYLQLNKRGLFVRIYGENLSKYSELLDLLPAQMVEEIDGASKCGRLDGSGCGLKCLGYDFVIDKRHYQKCRYNCFEFLLTPKTRPYIRAFVESELRSRVG